VCRLSFDKFFELIVKLGDCILGGSESSGQRGYLLLKMIASRDCCAGPFKKLDGFIVILRKSDRA
jgi:hypothetical protein